MDEDKKLASSARRSISKEKKLQDEDVLRSLQRSSTKLYWEDFRSQLKQNLSDRFLYGLGINVVASLFLRSAAIFPVGFGVFITYESIRAWWILPGPSSYLKEDE